MQMVDSWSSQTCEKEVKESIKETRAKVQNLLSSHPYRLQNSNNSDFAILF